MEKRIILNNQGTPFWIEDSGRLRNENTKRWLKGGYNKGYHFYNVYFKGKQYTLYTHRIVAEYFVPNDNPTDKTIVHHIDGNKTNNFYLNLQWVSPKEHNIITQEQKGSFKKSSTQKIQNLDDYGEIAQFRNSPYYATKNGKILNLSKNIEIKQETCGQYKRFMGYYNLNKKHFLVHRAIWEAFNGEIPEGYDIDHIDGDPSNNALENLQAISHQENILKRDIDLSYTVNNLYHGE